MNKFGRWANFEQPYTTMDYNYSLKVGIEKTYSWINQLYRDKNNNKFIKFTKK